MRVIDPGPSFGSAQDPKPKEKKMSVIEAPSPETAEVQYDEVSMILEQAAEWLETHLWHQGHSKYYSGMPTRCAGQAIVGACELNRELTLRAMDRFQRVVAPDYSPGLILYEGIYRWNDTPGRTKEEVCRKLREVAAQGGSDG